MAVSKDLRFCRLRGRFSILGIWLVQLLPWLRFRVLHVDAEKNWAAGTERCNLFGQPIRHAGSVSRSCSMHTSQSVGKSAHSSPDNRHPGGVGERLRSAPLTPCFLPTRSLESAWPPLYSIKSCSWSRSSRNRRSSRCSRGSGRGAGANSGAGASGVTGIFEDHNGH